MGFNNKITLGKEKANYIVEQRKIDNHNYKQNRYYKPNS